MNCIIQNCNDSPSNNEDPNFYGLSIVKNNSEADISNFFTAYKKKLWEM